MSKLEIRLAGSGGQGIILATIILAEAAVIAGKNTAQSQSYGPEARGGMCKAEVIISDEPIGFTKVTSPDFCSPSPNRRSISLVKVFLPTVS